MKTYQWLFIGALSLALTASGCFFDFDDDTPFSCVRGEGPIVTETLDVDPFDGIDLQLSATVFITQGSPQSVTVEGKANIIDELERDVNGNGVWQIETDDCVRDLDDLRIFITVPDIRRLKISGSGEIISENVLVADNIDLEINGSGDMDVALDADDVIGRISGSGKMVLEGEANDLIYRISGSGDLLAFDLLARTADIEISGSGDADVRVSDDLRVRISGSGDVRYKGNPTLDVSISGSGRVINAN